MLVFGEDDVDVLSEERTQDGLRKRKRGGSTTCSSFRAVVERILTYRMMYEEKRKAMTLPRAETSLS